MISREEAIKIAHEYYLEAEVIYCIDILGYTPEEALREWDL